MTPSLLTVTPLALPGDFLPPNRLRLVGPSITTNMKPNVFRIGLLVASWTREASQEGNMSFGLYIVGFIVLIIGLAIGANLMHIPAQWILVGVIVMIGLGILTGVKITRQRDPS